MFGIASHMPHRREFWYSVDDASGDYRYSAFTVMHNPQDIAEDAAEDYHTDHDGWESRWPLTFTLYESEHGPEVGRFIVEREYDPTFSASPVPLQAQDATRGTE